MSPKSAVLLLSLSMITPPMFSQSNALSPAINQFGLDLLRSSSGAGERGNQLLSPYSIEVALAMAYAGAEGKTREEMQRVKCWIDLNCPLWPDYVYRLNRPAQSQATTAPSK